MNAWNRRNGIAQLHIIMGLALFCMLGIFALLATHPRIIVVDENHPAAAATSTPETQNALATPPAQHAPETPSDASSSSQPVDKAAYDAKLFRIANLPIVKKTIAVTSTLPSGIVTSTLMTVTSTVKSAWPVKTAYPDAGALLPFNRIVAYYGNFYSKQMGVLGQYPEAAMLAMLASTTRMWAAADPLTPVIPAVDYIAVAAQGTAQPDGTYRLRMPPDQIEKAIDIAHKINGVVFLDVQVGLSTVQKELPLLAPYLKFPDVHLSIDPEFAMHDGERPGTMIGTMNAADINDAADFLANIVRENHLAPKILVVHRFTEDMVTNYKNVAPLPEVQIVMDMDGFGTPAKKIGTYTSVIASEPVQFTGFKLFYLNDAVTYGKHLMTPEEVLRLSPQPSYIQYQ